MSRAELLAEVAREAPRLAGAAVRLSVAIAHQLGMALADVQCLGLLAAGPAAPGWLAAQLGLTTGAMTKVLDRLEQGGYITRSADASDRRRVVIAADPAGLAALAARYDGMTQKMSAHLDGCTDGQLLAVLAFMRGGQQAADEEIARIRRGGRRHATRSPRQAGTSSAAASSQRPRGSS
jgi:DNA-binding MarR family transcriptional regulator